MGTEQDAPYYLCEGCRGEVDPADPNVVRAFEQRPIRAFGAATKMIDGMPVLFHRDCYPDDDRYRLDTENSVGPPE